MCMSAKAQRSMKARVSAWSASVSPGKPVIRSQVRATPGKYRRSSSVFSKKAAVSYLRFMALRVRSQPDCRDR